MESRKKFKLYTTNSFKPWQAWKNVCIYFQTSRYRDLHRRQVEASEEDLRGQLHHLLHLPPVLLHVPREYILPSGRCNKTGKRQNIWFGKYKTWTIFINKILANKYLLKIFLFNFYFFLISLLLFWIWHDKAVGVVPLVVRLVLTTEVQSSNHVISKFINCQLYWKEAGNCHARIE